MQAKILATGMAPDYYSIQGEVITAYVNGVSDSYDLSVLQEGDEVNGVSQIEGITPIRHAVRTNGEIKVTLCQQVGAGHWSESDWFDALTYNPDTIYAKLDTTKSYSGTASVWTRQGRMLYLDGEFVKESK